nr:hypothetical protein [Halovenus rubra]
MDDGAWLSVDDSRTVPVSNLWMLARHDVCDCQPADFLAEAFVDIGVQASSVEGRIAGVCVGCGEHGVTDWIELGRVDHTSGQFRAVIPDSIHVPRRRHRLSEPV